jgi:hypothetical protein
VLVETKPPEEFRTAGSSYGIFSSVAAATLASYVIATVVGLVSAALTGSAPTTSVVYCGVPFREMGWSNVTVTTVVAALAAVILIAAVGWELFTVMLRRRTLFVRLDKGVIIGKLLSRSKCRNHHRDAEITETHSTFERTLCALRVSAVITCFLWN